MHTLIFIDCATELPPMDERVLTVGADGHVGIHIYASNKYQSKPKPGWRQDAMGRLPFNPIVGWYPLPTPAPVPFADVPPVGARVVHTIFKAGTVLETHPPKGRVSARILIRFDKFGEKELFWSFCRHKLTAEPATAAKG